MWKIKKIGDFLELDSLEQLFELSKNQDQVKNSNKSDSRHLSFMQDLAWFKFIKEYAPNSIVVYNLQKKVKILFQHFDSQFGDLFWARHVFPYEHVLSYQDFRNLTRFLKNNNFIKEMFPNTFVMRMHFRALCENLKNRNYAMFDKHLICDNGSRWYKRIDFWHVSPAHSIDFEETVLIDLANYKFSSIVKRMIKKANKLGITITLGKGDKSDLNLFYKMYNYVTAKKGFHGWNYKYIMRQFSTLKKYNQAFIFWVQDKDNKLYSAIYFADNKNKIAFYVHGAGFVNKLQISPGYLVHSYAIEYFRQKGFDFVDLGGVSKIELQKQNVQQNMKYTKHPLYKNSLIKYRFGGQYVRFWHALDLPINKKWYVYAIKEFVRNKLNGWYN